ncbi:Ubiquinone biosynthesis protein coq9, mitochondrial [Actinomortierella ambigua]|uniref:Ubiquinone biosynthesis protein n=1 Tax=Actinomortierella ambigua TaxID=1343610 RepID=A0A9P6Q6F0_9FUNG|nr:Ubiquinone biosynthesis protein coq9, mitochondrial [Actinomortierella ambigua]
MASIARSTLLRLPKAALVTLPIATSRVAVGVFAARHFSHSPARYTSAREQPSPSAASKDGAADTTAADRAAKAAKTPDMILKKAMTYVPEHGWTVQSITKAAEDLGYPSIIHGMFPNGGADLIDYFLRDCLKRLPEELEGRMEGLKTHEKVRIGVLTRLGMVAPHIQRWPEALAIMGQPANVPMSLDHLAKIADEIWYLAGDRSADMNWYSKRAMLMGIYSSTEVYMTTDKTQNFQATQAFLDRRFEDAATVGKATNDLMQIAEFGAKSVMGILSSKGFRL